MTITALAPWFGSKRNLAPTIVAELGPHAAYWEPFCGSMAVLLARPPASMETVNDLHGDLINLARCIKHRHWGAVLYRWLRRTLMTDDLHREAKARLESGDTEEHGIIGAEAGPWEGVRPGRAYWYFVSSWLGRNGVAGTSSYNNGFCVRYTSNGGHAARRFSSAVASIPQWRERVRNLTILSLDGFDVLERVEDAKGTAIYCDPPYLVKGAKYTHDFADSDHDRLAGLLRRFTRARVVVSYYNHPKLAALYSGWTIRRIAVAKAMAHQGRRGKVATRATECLIMNGPSYAPAARGLFAEATP